METAVSLSYSIFLRLTNTDSKTKKSVHRFFLFIYLVFVFVYFVASTLLPFIAFIIQYPLTFEFATIFVVHVFVFEVLHSIYLSVLIFFMSLFFLHPL